MMKEYFLHPGAIFITEEPYKITTVLGSCLAVCFWDKKLKIGGINHYMLPLWNGTGLASPKYGNIAIQKLYDRMLEKGSKKQNIIAKIFGGGRVIRGKSDIFNIGDRNIEVARTMLNELEIPIVKSSVGGFKGRKIIFLTSTGEVYLKYLKNSLYL